MKTHLFVSARRAGLDAESLFNKMRVSWAAGARGCTNVNIWMCSALEKLAFKTGGVQGNCDVIVESSATQMIIIMRSFAAVARPD